MRDSLKIAIAQLNPTVGDIAELLEAYAPPVKRRHQPELPYWHLASDGIWHVHHAAELDRQASGFPTMSAFSS